MRPEFEMLRTACAIFVIALLFMVFNPLMIQYEVPKSVESLIYIVIAMNAGFSQLDCEAHKNIRFDNSMKFDYHYWVSF